VRRRISIAKKLGARANKGYEGHFSLWLARKARGPTARLLTHTGYQRILAPSLASNPRLIAASRVLPETE